MATTRGCPAMDRSSLTAAGLQSLAWCGWMPAVEYRRTPAAGGSAVAARALWTSAPVTTRVVTPAAAARPRTSARSRS